MNVDNWPSKIPSWRARKEKDRAFLNSRYSDFVAICANCQYFHLLLDAAKQMNFHVSVKTHKNATVLLTPDAKLKFEIQLDRLVFKDND